MKKWKWSIQKIELSLAALEETEGAPWQGIYKNPKGLYVYPDCLKPQASLVAHMVRNLPAMQETQVWSLGQEDTLEKGMATHSSILRWRIPWTEEPGRLQSMGSQRVGHDCMTKTFFHWISQAVMFSQKSIWIWSALTPFLMDLSSHSRDSTITWNNIILMICYILFPPQERVSYSHFSLWALLLLMVLPWKFQQISEFFTFSDQILSSPPFNSWYSFLPHFMRIDGDTMETVTDFIFLGSKITVVVTALMSLKDACSLEEKLWHT